MTKKLLLAATAAIAFAQPALLIPDTARAQAVVTDDQPMSADEIVDLLTQPRRFKIGTGADAATTAAPAEIAEPRLSFSNVNFAFNSAALTDNAKLQLDEIGQALKAPQLVASHIEIIGHTDSVGSDDYNLRLSLARAEAVKIYLVSSLGVDAARLDVKGAGERDLADRANPSNGINRRVEFVNLSAAGS
jgi:outer membrane protein OmpA-like peptidoglycan-associated protein